MSNSPAKTNGKIIFDQDWRVKLSNQKLFDDDAKAIFLDHYARFGRKYQAAAAANISVATVRMHQNPESKHYDPEFALAVLEAKAAYRDRVRETMYKLGVEGVEEKIFGGRFKDEVVGKKTVYAPSILIAEAKRVDPTYREKGPEVNVQINTGVLVAPASPASEEEWEAAQQKSPSASEAISPPSEAGSE